MKKTVSFNSVAWCYDFLSTLVFGDKLKKSQILLLEYIKDGDNVLIIGGGTGWIINEIFKRKNVLRIDYVESSKKMIAKAKEKTLKNNNKEGVSIHFIHGEEDQINTLQNYDAVLVCYFFDLFEAKRLEKIIERLSRSIKNKGLLLVADFYIDEYSPLKHKFLVRLMYAFFRHFCRIEARYLVPIRTLLSRYRYTNIHSVSTSNGLMLSEVYIKE